MTELEIKIIKFLLSSAVYSENAIMKNLGIDKNVLDKSLKILEDNGYLESYEEFIKREKLNEESDCCKTKKGKACSNCSSSSCNSCPSGSSCCDNNIFSDITDFSKIKVITMKAVDKFS
ncbi:MULTISPECIES: hypothetical protein [Fusobacterium]|uniref:hypothetical protein n=1 Tax=Fusobacterium TaxID=848 RepID=UPI00033E7405|nr:MULTISPECIES: hypothetical protein [Fusobacterium]ERT35288.1 hypothetical protein HMPREF1766_01346 [Fusobacterium nucleatum CTI-5]ERT36377.1 hypothetical protein HMPREF1540_01681 [Fusobacterium nucleatum CTI-3]MCL4581550.1 hypothetical protein [Fusobacterium nucleatum YWH7199]MCL4592588.1 hypothetical protein [Fusobacterium nucleatum YWH7053]CDA08052.1 putative uncharacterized protein [Fusobacterium sp. CAG:649]